MVRSGFLIVSMIWGALVFAACNAELPVEKDSETEVPVRFDTGRLAVRSSDPDEERISDLSLMVFDAYGRLEEHAYLEGNDIRRCSVWLTPGKEYRFAVCVNFGYEVKVSNVADLEKVTCHLAYPDEYRNGIPMYADSGLIGISGDTEITLSLIRLMSKISIRMDRSRLSDDVEMNVTAVRIGNCPKMTRVFIPNSVKDGDECFPLGFTKTGEDCWQLNRTETSHISGSVSLYMLENLQGRFAEDTIAKDCDKVFDGYDPRREKCSYIELDIDYISSDKASTGDCLRYRFYLGEDRNNLDVERNCHYRITVRPEGDGLSDDGWRVDKEGITTIEKPSFSYYPDSYIRGSIGDRIHIGCKVTPADTPFDVGLQYMERDKNDGIYDYVIDDDGFGATLTFTGPGRGLIYMSAGPPVDDAALWIIEVDLPNS